MSGSVNRLAAGAALGRFRLVRPLTRVVVVELLGEHDLATSPRLCDLFASLVVANHLVVVDLSETEFIDCSGLDAVVRAHGLAEEHDVEFRLQLGRAPIVRRMLEISGILERIPSFSTRELALAPARLQAG
jgi:anti-anti-sigma factor